MSVQRFDCQQLLPISLNQAWDFFSSPENLGVITPPWLNFRLLDPVTDKAYAGQILRYTLSPLPGYSTRWVTELTHVHAPDFFVDEQRFGPYRLWHHQHKFEALDDGVLMTDTVHYQLPLGHLGQLIAGAMVRKRIEAIFTFRRTKLQQLFAGESKAQR